MSPPRSTVRPADDCCDGDIDDVDELMVAASFYSRVGQCDEILVDVLRWVVLHRDLHLLSQVLPPFSLLFSFAAMTL